MFRAGESRSLCFVAERLCVCIRRGACQETPFPTESQDGLNEEMELVLVQTPVGDICIACTTTHQRGFSYIPIEQIPQALSESEIMFNRFFQGRNFVIGASGRYWGKRTPNVPSTKDGTFRDSKIRITTSIRVRWASNLTQAETRLPEHPSTFTSCPRKVPSVSFVSVRGMVQNGLQG